MTIGFVLYCLFLVAAGFFFGYRSNPDGEEKRRRLRQQKQDAEEALQALQADAMRDAVIREAFATGKPVYATMCDHGVAFDQATADRMTVPEIRKKYPRLDGVCPKGCGFGGIAYASKAHYVYGDW